MAVHVLEALVSIEAGDVVLVGTSAGTWADPVEIAIVARSRGAAVIALTMLDYELDPRLQAQHSSQRLLHECADVVIDLGGPFGDGELELPRSRTPILPSSGLTGVLAMWMIFAAAVDGLAARGLEPITWESVLVPGAPARNAKALEGYVRSGIGCRPLPDGPVAP